MKQRGINISGANVAPKPKAMSVKSSAIGKKQPPMKMKKCGYGVLKGK